VLLTPGNFRIGGGFNGGKLKYFDGDLPEGYILRPGGLIVTMTDLSKNMDTLGYPAWVPNFGTRIALHNQRLGLVELIDKSIDIKFLYYVMCSAGYRNEVMASSTGTTVHHTSPKRILNYKFLLPTLPEQRGIAATLGALDDKIESNRRAQRSTSQLVDALALKMLDSTETASVPLREVVEFNRVSYKPGDPDESVDYIDIASVSPGRVDAVARTTWGDAPSRARRGVRDGDVIYSTVRPGRQSYALILDPIESVVVSTGFAVMSPSPEIGSSLLTTVAGATDFAAYLKSVAHGSAYPAVSVDAMGNYLVDVPADPAVAKEFEVSTMPLRRRSHLLESENDALGRLREALLPELLSGRIRVPEAQEAVAEVSA